MPPADLQLIVDTTKLNMDRPGVMDGLERDLERIRLLIDQQEHPHRANAVKVIATNGAYMEAINYELTYGRKESEKFVPLGPSSRYPHEMLPFL